MKRRKAYDYDFNFNKEIKIYKSFGKKCKKTGREQLYNYTEWEQQIETKY